MPRAMPISGAMVRERGRGLEGWLVGDVSLVVFILGGGISGRTGFERAGGIKSWMLLRGSSIMQ